MTVELLIDRRKCDLGGGFEVGACRRVDAVYPSAPSLSRSAVLAAARD